MKKTFAFGAATQQGTWPVQEDGFYLDPVAQIYAVGDGFGGRGAGDLVVKQVLEELRLSGRKNLGPDFLKKSHEKILKRNEAVSISRRGGCSFSLMEVQQANARINSVGACSVFLFRAGKILPVLIPQASLRKEFQPLLADQAIGLPGEIQPERRTISLESGDILGMCSSGVEWESEEFLQSLLEQLSFRSPGEDLSSISSHLVENASLSSQGWNRTLLFVEYAAGLSSPSS